MHTDPALYEEVLGGIQSPKPGWCPPSTPGATYFGFLPLNPTLASGKAIGVWWSSRPAANRGIHGLPTSWGRAVGDAPGTLTAANPPTGEIVPVVTGGGSPAMPAPVPSYPLGWLLEAGATPSLGHHPAGRRPHPWMRRRCAAGWVPEDQSETPGW